MVNDFWFRSNRIIEIKGRLSGRAGLARGSTNDQMSGVECCIGFTVSPDRGTLAARRAFTGMTRNRRNTHTIELELRAERETREAIIAAAVAGADAVVLEAIASDPIPLDAVKDDTSYKRHRRTHS